MQAAELFDVPGSNKYKVEEEVGHGSFSEVSGCCPTPNSLPGSTTRRPHRQTQHSDPQPHHLPVHCNL